MFNKYARKYYRNHIFGTALVNNIVTQRAIVEQSENIFQVQYNKSVIITYTYIYMYYIISKILPR